MSSQIVFPEQQPRYDFDRDVLVFHALTDGKPVEVVVTGELLLSRFGASDMTEASLREAFSKNREPIHEIAREHIENGWIDEEGRVFLTTRLTRLKVSFVLGRPESGKRLAIFHRMLTDIIGPNAGEVSVEWNDADDPNQPELPGGRMVSLKIVDPSMEASTKIYVGRRDYEDADRFGVLLAGLWATILRNRSRKLTPTSG